MDESKIHGMVIQYDCYQLSYALSPSHHHKFIGCILYVLTFPVMAGL